MQKLDLKKDLKAYYMPPKKPQIVTVPCFQFVMIDGTVEQGHGPGDSQGFQEAMQSLYGISYTLKFMLKKRAVDPIDYPVMGMEGLWWVEDGLFDISVKDNWHYTLMILQPPVITPALFAEGLEQLKRKRGEQEIFSRLRLADYDEGLCVQCMHIGPYADEPATVERMRLFAAQNGYRDRVGPNGKHHEIYLGDPRNADPSKLKTVLRHPLEKAG